ncbi:MAG TPA: SLC13 family permease [Methylomirabilota bacterium]|nr:SLC13 family permease [Methylomirabilota bacterium]
MSFFAAAGSVDLWPLAVLVMSVAVIIVAITVLRLNAFIALILAAITAGLLSTPGRLPGEAEGKSHLIQAVEVAAAEFGSTAGRIGIVIGLASIISVCLMESGAADKVVRRFLAAFGAKRAGGAIVTSSYILSIPIFFDTFFMLLLPLARAMALRTGKDFLLYVMAICAAGVVTHSLIAPHPGPLAMAESLQLDLGLTIVLGLGFGVLPVLAGWMACKWINKRMQIPLRETAGASINDLKNIVEKPESQLPGFVASITPVVLPIILISMASTFIALQGKILDLRAIKDMPGLVRKLNEAGTPPLQHVTAHLPSAIQTQLPAWAAKNEVDPAAQKALLDALNKALKDPKFNNPEAFKGVALRPELASFTPANLQGDNIIRHNRSLLEDALPEHFVKTSGIHPNLMKWGDFIGNRNVALIIGAAIAMAVLMRQRKLGFGAVEEMIGPALATGAMVILITSAGGAFGLMLRNAGVGDTIRDLTAGREINLILLSWFVAAVIRMAQGSATVAMLTTAAMVYPIMAAGTLPYHPIYIFVAIGFGAMFFSWMNDSGFWVVAKLSGFTEKETLKSWSILVSVMSVTGLLECLVFAPIFPMK